MGLIEYYIIFALTTGITSCYEFMFPAIRKARQAGIVNTFTENTLLSYTTYIVISTIFAPFTIFPILFMEANAKYKLGLEKVVLEPNK
jgi:hypothetical protein